MMRAFWLQFLAWLVPVTAFAAGGEGHGDHGEFSFKHILTNTEFLASVENFLLLAFVLFWFGRKPIAEFLSKRRREMEQAMTEAAAMKAKAEARYQEYTARLEQLDAELDKLKVDIKQGAEEDKKRILADAEEASQRMRKETEALIEMHAQGLSSQLRREVVEAATAAARDVLQGAVSADDQQRLAGDFREQVAQGGGQA